MSSASRIPDIHVGRTKVEVVKTLHLICFLLHRHFMIVATAVSVVAPDMSSLRVSLSGAPGYLEIRQIHLITSYDHSIINKENSKELL